GIVVRLFLSARGQFPSKRPLLGPPIVSVWYCVELAEAERRRDLSEVRARLAYLARLAADVVESRAFRRPARALPGVDFLLHLALVVARVALTPLVRQRLAIFAAQQSADDMKPGGIGQDAFRAAHPGELPALVSDPVCVSASVGGVEAKPSQQL